MKDTDPVLGLDQHFFNLRTGYLRCDREYFNLDCTRVHVLCIAWKKLFHKSSDSR